MKKLATAILLILICLFIPGGVLAAEMNSAPEDAALDAAPEDASLDAAPEDASLDAAALADKLELDDLYAEIGRIDELLAEHNAGISLADIWRSMLAGEADIDFNTIWQALLSMVFGNIQGSAALLGQLILLSLFAVILTLLKDRFAGGEISEISRWVVYLLLIGIAIAAFIPSLNSASSTVMVLRDFIYAALPVLLPLLAAIGGVSTVSLISPALLFIVSLLMSLLANLIFPMITFSAILRICGGLAPRISLNKMADLFRDFAKGLLGITTTVFVAFLGLAGMATASLDGLAVKAVKSASGAFIPIVGGTLADALDSVVGTALVLKNVIGLVGAIAIIFICAVPAIQILLQAIVFRIAGALIQPLGEEKLAEAVTGLGNSMILLFAALAVCGLFAYFAIALIVGLGNITMMMR